MRIIIIGAGITGLSTYLFLMKHLPQSSCHQITIYERRPYSLDAALSSTTIPTAVKGGGLVVLANGMRVLFDLDPELAKRVASQGFECRKIAFGNAAGRVLGEQKKTSGRECCISISRDGLRACLLDHVKKVRGDGIVKHRKVEGVEWDKERGKAILRLADGEEEADFVIGADGVNSITRKGLFRSETHSPKYR